MGARVGAFVAAHPELGKIPWRRVAREVFRCTPSDALAKRHQRAYAEWLASAGAGRLTAFAAGAENRTLRRRRPHERDAARRHKGEWISFELLQWFVDNVEAIKCRADSRMMLDTARRLKAQLVATGVPETELPKISRGWLFRWRRAQGISIRRGTVKFQISWQKTKDRIRCMLGNIFRLRRLWALCHPGVPMRWLSADQKPSWMNNAARRPMYARKGARDVGAKDWGLDMRWRANILARTQGRALVRIIGQAPVRACVLWHVQRPGSTYVSTPCVLWSVCPCVFVHRKKGGCPLAGPGGLCIPARERARPRVPARVVSTIAGACLRTYVRSYARASPR